MTRSLKKGVYVDKGLLEKINKMIGLGKKGPIKAWSRRSTITPEMVGFTFEVHNGKNFLVVAVQEAMIGHKLGEFSPTRTFKAHSSKKDK